MAQENQQVLIAVKDADELTPAFAGLDVTRISATTVAQAMSCLKQQPIDLVILDQALDHSEAFVAHLAKHFPDVDCVLLADRTNPDAVLAAIDSHAPCLFLLRPVQIDKLQTLLSERLALRQLVQQNQHLQVQTEAMNAQLQELNNHLEQQVTARTRQLQTSQDSLSQAYGDLKSSYRSVVRMFSTLTAQRLGMRSGADYQHMNALLVQVAGELGITGKSLKQLFYAWQLRNIGKLCFPDVILATPYVKMAPDLQRIFHTHPVRAQAATFLVKPLYAAGQIIRQHKEYRDGSGYPMKLKASEISLAAQVLCVVNDYFELIQGRLQARSYSTSEALAYLQEQAGTRYHPDAVAALAKQQALLVQSHGALHDARLTSVDLAPGMTLSRDLVSAEGVLLLSAGLEVDTLMIQRIRELEANLEEHFVIFVNRGAR